MTSYCHTCGRWETLTSWLCAACHSLWSTGAAARSREAHLKLPLH